MTCPGASAPTPAPTLAFMISTTVAHPPFDMLNVMTMGRINTTEKMYPWHTHDLMVGRDKLMMNEDGIADHPGVTDPTAIFYSHDGKTMYMAFVGTHRPPPASPSEYTRHQATRVWATVSHLGTRCEGLSAPPLSLLVPA